MYLLIEILKERAPLISFPTDQISGAFVGPQHVEIIFNPVWIISGHIVGS